MTRAPAARAMWRANVATPPPIPSTRTVSPGRSCRPADQRAPRGQAGERQRRGLLPREPLGLGHHVLGGDADELGVGAVIGTAQDAEARLRRGLATAPAERREDDDLVALGDTRRRRRRACGRHRRRRSRGSPGAGRGRCPCAGTRRAGSARRREARRRPRRARAPGSGTDGEREDLRGAGLGELDGVHGGSLDGR